MKSLGNRRFCGGMWRNVARLAGLWASGSDTFPLLCGVGPERSVLPWRYREGGEPTLARAQAPMWGLALPRVRWETWGQLPRPLPLTALSLRVLVVTSSEKPSWVPLVKACTLLCSALRVTRVSAWPGPCTKLGASEEQGAGFTRSCSPFASRGAWYGVDPQQAFAE